MKEDTEISPIKTKEGHRRNQTSIFDYFKYQIDQNDGEVDLSKNQLNNQSQQKDYNKIQSIDQIKQQQIYAKNQQHNFQQFSQYSPNPILSNSTWNHGECLNQYPINQNSSKSRALKQFFIEKIRDILELEYLSKEDLQPYWRNKLLLFITLFFLTIGNIIDVFFQKNLNESAVNMRIILISSFIALSGLSHFMLYFKNKNKDSTNSANIPILSCCFSENQMAKKLITQIFIIIVCLVLFIGYAKCIAGSLDFSSSNSRIQNQINSQSLAVQLIEVILLYQYTSTFFLSFFLLKLAFLVSVFMINFFLLGFHENNNNYYYFIALVIQLLIEYESTVISQDAQFQFNTNRNISTISLPTEMRQPIKSTNIMPTLCFHTNITENLKKYQNQISQNETQRFYTKHQKNCKRCMTQEDGSKKGSQLETIGVLKSDQKDNSVRQQSSLNRFKIRSQKITSAGEINQNTLMSQLKNQRECRLENFLIKDIEESDNRNDVYDYRSQKKQSSSSAQSINKTKKITIDNIRTSNYINGEQGGSNRSKQNSDNNGEKSNDFNKILDNSLEVSDEIKVCLSEPSKGKIQSQNDLQKSSSSSQTISNQNVRSMAASDFSPINRLTRNFSLFRRLQEQIQIEEKTSQEEAETYAFTPHRQENLVETINLHRSNSLGTLQQKSCQMQKSANFNSQTLFGNQQNIIQSIYNTQKNNNTNQSNIIPQINQNSSNQCQGFGQHPLISIQNPPNNLFYSFTEKSQDDEQKTTEQNEQQKSNGEQNQISESINQQSHKLKMKQLFSRNRQVSIEYKRDKLNGYSLTPLGFPRTHTSTHSMAANAQQKTKLYKNILKYLPEEGVILIDKNHNIHFANLYAQQLFPKSSPVLLFNDLVQLKSIETLENYKQYLNDILEQKCCEQNDCKLRNISQNFTKVQLTDSINFNNQEQNNQNYWIQSNNQNQNQISQQILPLTKQYSKTSLRNINIQQQNNASQIVNGKTPKENTVNSNNQSTINQNTFTQFYQQTSNCIHMSSNYNFPIGGIPPYVASSASINPTQRLSQSNYFMKLDLFRQAKENIQLKENIIRCKSFLEQFEQIIENFRQLSASYKQYGIASQNKFTTLLYRPLNNQKQESIEDVQIFEVQFIPCYLGYTEGVVVTLRDVTHFNQIKVLKDINERKSNILRNVSHELRQPLNCIISMMQLTRDSYNDQKLIQEYINPTLYSCQILLNLLNDFLDISQIQAGTFKLTNVYFSIKKLFLNIFQMMKASIQIRSLNFVLNITNENEIPDEIKSDPHRIQQIITNLLGNAVKFTEHGDIVLTLEKQSQYIYKISVQDSGIGITEEGQKNLFKTFGKVDQDIKSILNPQGVGLGLMISNILAQQLGPQEDRGLQVESKIGKGTKFYFYLMDKTFQDKELVSFTQINNNLRDKQISPQNLQNNLPQVRRATSRNMETSVFFQGQIMDSQEDFCSNSQQIVMQPLNMITRQQHLNQICQSSLSFESVQECGYNNIDNLVYRNPLMKLLPNEVHENNIKKIDQKNNNYCTNNNNQYESQIPPHRMSYNYVISNKLLDLNSEQGLSEKDGIKGQNNHKKKNQLQQSQFITQGIALRQQTLILQQDYSPRVQKLLVDDIVNYQKQKQRKCSCLNTKDVLVVDDNDFNIYVLDKYLKTFFIDAETCTNGPSSEKKVKDKIENSKCEECKIFKIIFMDLNLGQISGIQTANNIKQIYNQYKLSSPVIIACTGHVDEDSVQSCIQNGFNDFLAKPIIKDQLVEIIQKYLKVEV